ncbi:MAG TPA: hypothetical protein VM598_03080 [Bdellovibrionota bacterium]|nr:hypothetical protein [Bdellovibrionota bacterium]
MSLKNSLCVLTALFLATVALAEDRQDPREPYYSPSGYGMSAIEYWGSCGYAGGRGVSFGFRTNRVESNQECARKAYQEMKSAIDANPAEMGELAALGGPRTIYLIMSDCTQEGAEPLTASVWHYNARSDGRGGLIKFHAVTQVSVTESGERTVECKVPGAEEFYQFVRDVRDRIRAGR